MIAHNFWQPYNQLYLVSVNVNRKLVSLYAGQKNMMQLKLAYQRPFTCVCYSDTAWWAYLMFRLMKTDGKLGEVFM